MVNSTLKSIDDNVQHFSLLYVFALFLFLLLLAVGIFAFNSYQNINKIQENVSQYYEKTISSLSDNQKTMIQILEQLKIQHEQQDELLKRK